MGEPTETEVKLPVASLETLRESLRRIGARLTRERHFEDNVLFDDGAGRLASAGAVLRLRRTSRESVLTYKGPRRVEDGIKVREERQTVVEMPDEIHAIFASLGYRPVFRYQKYREVWTHRGQEILADETPVGTFLEIEGDAEGIRAVTAELGLDPADYMTESYVDIFFAQGGEGDMLFEGESGPGARD
jgi:adenylate cyclase class 2